jgi:hypothetical protein
LRRYWKHLKEGKYSPPPKQPQSADGRDFGPLGVAT